MLIAITTIAVTAVYNPKLIDQLLGLQGPPHLSDNELIANFHHNREEFEQLRKMINQDIGLARITPDQIEPENSERVGIGMSRIAEYRALLKKAGVRGGISVSTDRKVVELISTYRGFVTHNSQKGYLYIDGSVDNELIADLDRFSASEIGSGVRHIEGNWYLFFEGY
jgi:hypothetical protein